ncbi:hypothetical protein SORBI_3004G134400 [Sorghum bicolor]|uniref:Uncharacterized protein n=1 Tax=Sorghum bicolor TaxID=4558 RepID=A0A194YPF0_SORBI|nr:hypothetical protein SORBI_3004G134400 [Sorghum bicolor]
MIGAGLIVFHTLSYPCLPRLIPQTVKPHRSTAYLATHLGQPPVSLRRLHCLPRSPPPSPLFLCFQP